MMYNWSRAMLASKTLNKNAKLIGSILATYANPDGTRCFPTQLTIANDFGIDHASVERGIHDLRAADFLATHRRPYQFLIDGKPISDMSNEKPLNPEGKVPQHRGKNPSPVRSIPDHDQSHGPRSGGPTLPSASASPNGWDWINANLQEYDTLLKYKPGSAQRIVNLSKASGDSAREIAQQMEKDMNAVRGVKPRRA
jgi:hypothetical protein